MDEEFFKIVLVLIIILIITISYFYKQNNKINSNKEWREKYFCNFNFQQQSKEIEVIKRLKFKLNPFD